jgi:hypothetical protein
VRVAKWPPISTGFPPYPVNLSYCQLSTTYPSTTFAVTSDGTLTVDPEIEFTVNGGALVTSAIVAEGDKIKLYGDSSDQYETPVPYTINIDGAEYDTWILTTIPEAIAGWTDKEYFTDGEYWTD